MEMMKERFAKLLLGEDMSGSGKGVGTALAISNAVTNLCGQKLTPSLLQFFFCRFYSWTRQFLVEFRRRALLCSYDLRPAVEAGAAPAGEEGHVAAGDELAALRQRPHRRTGPHLAVIPRRGQARGTEQRQPSSVPSFLHISTVSRRAAIVSRCQLRASPFYAYGPAAGRLNSRL